VQLAPSWTAAAEPSTLPRSASMSNHSPIPSLVKRQNHLGSAIADILQGLDRLLVMSPP